MATLWLEMSPNVPGTAAWSAHSLPKFRGMDQILLTCKCKLHMSTSLNSAQTNTSIMHRIVINTRLLIMGDWTTRTKKRQCFDHGSHFSGVVGVNSGTRESQMSLGGNDGTEHDIDAPTRRSGNHTLSSKRFTIINTSTTICINSPPTINIASFTCYGTITGKVWIPGLGLGKAGRCGAGRQGSAAQDTLFGTRGRRQE